ncbi:staphylopine family metallophore export MFS transporter CntE [Lysinibacillus sp. NPDC093712]|uniref:staphylopine family metallophore export MFS transporter CntE n=1 Tax=Lysinibacillus sp. NPDC093712 TaxID=3390579 RepID=UPI003CFE367A
MISDNNKIFRSEATSPLLLRIYGLTFLFYSANAIIQIVLPLHTQNKGMDNSEIGLMIGAYLFVSMLLRPWVGVVVDFLGSRKVIRIILFSHLGVLLLYSWSISEDFLIIRGLQGAVSAFFSLAVQQIVLNELPERERVQGLSLYSLFGMLPTVVWPIFALYIWEYGGFAWFILSLGILGFLTLLAGYPLVYSKDEVNMVRQEISKIQTEAWYKKVLHTIVNRSFIASSMVMFTASAGFGAVTAFLTLYVKQIEIGHAGMYFAIQSGIMVMARFIFRNKLPSDGKWHAKPLSLLLFSMSLGLTMTAIAPFFGYSISLYLGAAAVGLGMASLYPILGAYLSITLGPDTRKIWMGLFISMSDFGVVIGSIGMGVIADWIGYSFVFALCAVMLLVVGVLTARCGKWLSS